jgi:nicotinamide-nucleotide amidase
MDLEIVTVGTELLLGFTHDSNASDIARALAAVGIRVARKCTVADRALDVRDAVAGALGRSGCVIVTGGLGPTRDDVTKGAVAELFGAPLELDARYLAELERRFAALGRGPMPLSNRTQAEVPRGATVLRNPRGTAPGLWLEGGPGIAVLLPGVPHEMRGLLHEEVIPRLRARLGAGGADLPVTRSRTLRTAGVTESALADLLGPHEEALAPVTLAYLPQGVGVDLRLTAWKLASVPADQALGRAVERVRGILGEHCYGEDEDDLAAVVLDRLRRAGLRLAIAESCTGGLLSARITAIAGASDVFLGGVISYADDSKVRDLGVPETLLVEHGAVSEPVVRSLAAGAARRFGAQAAIAVTGIAGPSGGTPTKPVGTVWLCALVDEQERSTCVRLPGDRRLVQTRSAQAALDLLRRLLLEAQSGVLP